MLKILPNIAIFANLALLGFVAFPAAAQIDPNRVIATINGDDIKGEEYYHRMEFLPGLGKRLSGSFVEAAPGFFTLEELITERLVYQLAKEKGVYPTDLEVDAELKNEETDKPNLVESWTAMGGTLDDLRNTVKYSLAQFKIETFGITLTDQEVEAFYNANPTMYTVPKQVKLSVVVVADDAGKTDVEKALAAGTAFADVARQYSIDVTKTVGGAYGTMPEGVLPAPVQTALKGVKIGENTDWIQMQVNQDTTAFLKFKLLDVIPPRKLTLDDQLRRRIRKQLMLDRGHNKNHIQDEMRTMRNAAKIQISQPEFAKAYQEFLKAYLKQTGGSDASPLNPPSSN